MKKILFAAVCAVSAFAATPAFAEDGGEGRAEVRGGVIFVPGDSAAVAGLAGGYDWDLGGMFAGFELSADKVLEGGGPTALGITGRLGGKVGDSTKLYGLGGYTFLSCGGCVDAWTAGAGVQQKMGEKVYLKAEYRHLFTTNGAPDADVVLAGIGFSV